MRSFLRSKKGSQPEQAAVVPPVESEPTTAVESLASTTKPEELQTRSDSLKSSEIDADHEASKDEKPAAQGPPADKPASEYPPLRGQIIIMVALLCSVFLIALDQTIVATAIPRMTDEFHSLNDVGWYGSAFMLTASCFQLLFGRIYTFYTPKYVFMGLIFVFEIGSAVCGAAPSSTAFIIGRAIAGIGLAGIMSGAVILMVGALPLDKRPFWMGLFGAIFGVASVAGPLLGGAFTTDVSWRWCFYINLPIGGAVLVILLFILKPTPAVQKGLPFRKQIAQLDLLGELFLFPCIVCLLLALQWGGSTYAFSNWRIILLFTFFGLLFIGFVLVQIFMQETATLPARIIRNRSMIFGQLHTFCISAGMLSLIYYLAIWFQAIKGVSAVKSGIDTIPLVLSLVVGNISAGQIVGRIGYYTLMAWVSSIVMPIGAGLIYTFNPHTHSGTWIGFQIIVGLGIGFGMQQGTMAAQTVLEKKDVSMGVTLLMFQRQLAGAIFVSVSQNVFTTKLVKELTAMGLGLNVKDIVNAGATNLRIAVPAEVLPDLLARYNDAIRQVFLVALVMACLSAIGAVGMEWKNLKDKNQPGAGGAGVGKGKKEGTTTPEEKV